MLKRIKNLWNLGKYRVEDDRTFELASENGQVVAAAPRLEKRLVLDEPLGDGHAEFLGEGSSDEFEEQEKKDKGQHGIFGIGK